MADESKMSSTGSPVQNQDATPPDDVLPAASSIAAKVSSTAVLTIHKPLPEEHPFYSVVGRVASEWSHLEHILDLTIWEIIGIRPEIAACVTSQILGVNPR